MSRLIVFFLFLATAFAIAHLVATAGSFYWYYWWFDVVMHFWGGLLLGLGVHALCRLKSVPLTPSLILVLLTLTTAAVSWEVFEWVFGLYNPVRYVFDTFQDVALAFGGGLLAHFLLLHLYNRQI